MQRIIIKTRYFSVQDLAILFVIATLIYGVSEIAREWQTGYHPITEIDLSIRSLPYYTLLSGIRGTVAYLISLTFTLVVGYTAAKSKSAENLILPALDILQSIPVLGFLPGLILGLVALFPHSNFGIELAAIISIFTGQVWNMTFSFYSSLKSIPTEFMEAATVMNLTRVQRFFRMELPFSAVNLAWNSLLSMAGGWFFLIPCEAMILGNREFRLPGIGSYMSMAIRQNDQKAMLFGIIAMVSLIVVMDFVIWRPVLSWTRRFRIEDVPGAVSVEPLMQIWLRESNIVREVKLFYQHTILPRKEIFRRIIAPIGRVYQSVAGLGGRFFSRVRYRVRHIRRLRSVRILDLGLLGLFLASIGYGSFNLLLILFKVSPATWLDLLIDVLCTLLRVLASLTLATLWAVPAGIWIGISPKRIRFAQPLIQIFASFPAPMLYPIILGLLFTFHVPYSIGAMFLMLVGVQWYVLFNVMAGALRIPSQLSDNLALMNIPAWERWKVLYFPSIFPALVTGWVTAAGGAWNASVVAEYILYNGEILKTSGLGAAISIAIVNEDFSLLAASLTLMVFVVVLLNRTVWARIYRIAQTRFRMEA